MRSRQRTWPVYIQQLEAACLANPQSADLRTCLGMAYAVNYDVYKSMDALEDARAVDPDNFWAQLKYAELHYRLRALESRRRRNAKGRRPRAETRCSCPWRASRCRRSATLKHCERAQRATGPSR